MQLSGYMGIVRRWWWTLLVATWIAGLSGFVLASQVAPTYESRASLLVGPINADNNTIRASGELVQTYAVLATSQAIVEGVVADAGLNISPDKLRSMIRVTANDTTRILAINAQSQDPARAAEIANLVSQKLRELTERGDTRPEGRLEVIDFAQPIPDPVAPQVSLLVLLAAAAGLVGALVVAMLIEYLTSAVRSPEDLVGKVDLPLLGRVRFGSRGDAGQPLLVLSDPHSRAASDIRLLAAQLVLGREDSANRALLVVDAREGGSAATVGANLAATLAQAAERVVLIDGDWTSRALSRSLDLPVAEFDASAQDLDTFHRSTAIPSLTVIPAPAQGTPVPSSARHVRHLITRELERADRVVIVAPAISATTDALSWARSADAVIIAVPRDEARRNEVVDAVAALTRLGAPVVGWVLTDAAGRGPRRLLGGGSGRGTNAMPADAASIYPAAERPDRAGVRQVRRPRQAVTALEAARDQRDTPDPGTETGRSVR